ncbi:lin2375 protein [Streptococcus acidominimus]|uniref:Lin2375 protein n=1 Tax=Streptococcus acidominimus TaxID=1326 RepID=A0A239X1P9_STRAI|nr:phage holin [Streptococcus acidominimus]SNV39978.1 lin2375 protein [Streptococcus acidominimus]
MGINWKVRFNKSNKTFLARFLLAIFVPILTYFGLEAQDLTTWQAVFDLVVKAVSNPFVVGFTVVNIINVLPDPTTTGLSDSSRAMSYREPK